MKNNNVLKNKYGLMLKQIYKSVLKVYKSYYIKYLLYSKIF